MRAPRPPVRQRAALGRADLLLLLAAGVIGDDAAAALCGYVAIEAEPVATPAASGGTAAAGRDAASAADANPSEALLPPLRATHYTVAASGRDPLPDGSDVFDAEGDVLDALPQADPRCDPPPLQPLWPARRMAALLRRSLRVPTPSAQIDVERWVRLVAHGAPLPQRPPQRRLPSWHGAAALLIHGHSHVDPLNEDLQLLARQALAWSGGAARVVWIDAQGGDAWLARRAGPRRALRWFPAPVGLVTAAERWLWVGSVAALHDDAAAPWLACVRRQLLRRRQVHWLRPGAAAAGSAGTGAAPRGMQAIGWDRATALQMRAAPGAGVAAADQELLLAALSMAVLVEPALLRALRTALSLPVDAELQAWSHPNVQAFGTTACVVRPDVLPAHRERARAAGSAWCRQVAALIAGHHRHLSPLVRDEEAAVAADLAGAGAGAAGRPWTELARTLHRADDPALAGSLGRYVRRLGPRAHPSLWRTVPGLAEAWVLAEREAVESGLPLPEGLPDAAVRRVLAGRPGAAALRQWALVQREGGFWLLPADAADVHVPLATLALPGSTHGLLVESAPGRRWQTLGSVGTPLAPSDPEHPVRVSWQDESLTIAAVPRPAWAHEWGRDANGLYALSPPLGAWQQRLRWPVTEAVVGAPLDVRAGVGLRFGVDPDHGPFVLLGVGGQVQTLRWMPPGEFEMGSSDAERARISDEGFRAHCADESPRHRVRLTQGWWLADTACTQAFWRALMDDNPSEFKGNDEAPVESVSFDDVQVFLARLQRLLPAGVEAVLPTEAEWEYACRAGTDTAFSFGDRVAWEQANLGGLQDFDASQGGRHEGHVVSVKARPANPWGLFQMHGNVYEWCADGMRLYVPVRRAYAVEDPVGPQDQGPEALRAVRGGSWIHGAWLARSACRSAIRRGDRYRNLGFRLALRSSSPVQPSPEAPPASPAPEAPGPAARRDAGPQGPGWIETIKRVVSPGAAKRKRRR